MLICFVLLLVSMFLLALSQHKNYKLFVTSKLSVSNLITLRSVAAITIVLSMAPLVQEAHLGIAVIEWFFLVSFAIVFTSLFLSYRGLTVRRTPV